MGAQEVDEFLRSMVKPDNLNQLELVIKKGRRLVKYIDKKGVNHPDDPYDYVKAYIIRMQQNAESSKLLLENGYGASAIQFVRLFIEDFLNLSYLLKNNTKTPKEQLIQFDDHKNFAKPIQYVRLLEELDISLDIDLKRKAEEKLSTFRGKYRNSEGRKGWALKSLAEMCRELSEITNDDTYKEMYTLMYSLFSEDTHGLSAPFFESTKDAIFGIENVIYGHNYRGDETVKNIAGLYEESLNIIITFYGIEDWDD